MSKEKNRLIEDIIKFLGGALILLLTVFFIVDKTKFWILFGIIIIALVIEIIVYVNRFWGHIFTKHNKSTWVARKLHKAIIKKGVDAKLEYPDGHKHIDIYIPSARIAIEVDGIQHYTNPKQIISDLGRSRGSQKKGVDTIHIPNDLVVKYLKKITNALVEVAKELAYK